MKRGKIILFLLILTTFFVISSCLVMAEERSIFIGDLIEIKVTSQNVTIAELRDKFKDFEIVDIKEDTDSYLITIRSFEPGEKTVQIGNKQIKINIKSTLKEIKRSGVFEGDLNPEAAGAPIAWKYVFYVLLIIFLLTGGGCLWRYLKGRKVVTYSPYQRFINQTNDISPDDGDYLVKLTSNFKEYIESSYSCTIRGKTSSEIIKKISCIASNEAERNDQLGCMASKEAEKNDQPGCMASNEAKRSDQPGCMASNEAKRSDQPDLQAILPGIEHWLSESDYFKFTGITVSTEKKQELLENLVSLVRKIEATKEGES